MASPGETLFWDLVDELRASDPRVREGTIMGGRCARVDAEFLALVDRGTGALVVKLPRARVSDLIERGIGRAFAPAGRIFREWVAIPDVDRSLWSELLADSVRFVSTKE